MPASLPILCFLFAFAPTVETQFVQVAHVFSRVEVGGAIPLRHGRLC